MKRRTKLAVVVGADLLLVVLLCFFLVPIIPGITPPHCGPYSPDEHESLSFEILGIGTTYNFGYLSWHWNHSYPRVPCF